MAGRKSDFVLPTKSLDDLFSTQEERDEAKLQKIRDIPLTEIDDFPDHPFQVREDVQLVTGRTTCGEMLQLDFAAERTALYRAELCVKSERLCTNLYPEIQSGTG